MEVAHLMAALAMLPFLVYIEHEFGINGFFGVVVRLRRTTTPKKQSFSANPNSRY
jgi:hypothetical protein